MVGRKVFLNGSGTASESQVFVYQDGQVVLQFDGTGNNDLGISDLSHRYLWGPTVDQLFADEEVNSLTNAALNDTLWALTDHLGTPRDWIDDSATVVDHAQYDSYGNRLNTAAIDAAFGWTGRYHDPITGLNWNGGRWYNSAINRWMSEDPIKDGTNWNTYVGNKPTMFVDPDGLAEQPPGETTDEMTWWEYLFTGRVRSKAKDKNSLGVLDNNRRGAWGAESGQNTCDAFRQAGEMAAERLKSTGTDVAIEVSTAGAGGLVVWLRRGAQAKRLSLAGQLGLHFDDQRKLLRIAMNSVNSGKAAHHLIPLEAITKYRALMEKGARGGFNINGCKNGILLGKADHLWNHPEYNKAVLDRLRQIQNQAGNLSDSEIAKLLQEIADALREAIGAGTFGPWG